MFNKLRLQLTLINVAVVSFIFLIFFLGSFLVIWRITHYQTGQLFNLISSSYGLGDAPVKVGYEEHHFEYFYVKLNPTGKITAASSYIDIKNKQIQELVAKAVISSKRKGTVDLTPEDDSYHFVKNNLDHSLGTSLIFINFHSRNELFRNLFVALMLGSIFGFVLALLGGLFMANRSLIPIKESWKRQKDFVADASHELRTPLAVIETTVDLLISKRKQTIDSQIKWLKNIQTENKRMTKLVQDLLFIARADSEQVLLEMRIFPLYSALLEAYSPFEALALQRGICLKPFGGPPINFLGDEAKIKQLVVILMDNAIKHTPSGGEVGMILLDTGGAVEITVTDNGEGIDKEHITKIFQRFYRIDKARSRKEGSVGLGLSIAEWIVKKHHGTIKVESAKNKGARFSIILPNKRI
jgi:two-component system, OmpR family, sensor histidine kinase CiaH